MQAFAPSTREESLSPDELQDRIRRILNGDFTGMAQVHFEAGKTLTLFILNGKVRQINLRNHRLPDQNWELPLAMYGAGMLELRSMPGRAMMFKKILMEELTEVSSQPAGTNQLKTMFSLAQSNAVPALFHIQWESAEGFVLIAGRSIPKRHAVLLTNGGTEDGPIALEQIQAWNEAQCRVTIHHGDIRNQAWLEVYLNILFESYCRNILNHYGQLTGMVMVKGVLQGISVIAEIRGWNISTKENHLTDASLFADAASAASAYREIISAIKIRIEPIIGSSLTANLLKQSRESAKDVYKLIEDTFSLVAEVRS